MDICIRTQRRGADGWGHLVRTATLARYLEEMLPCSRVVVMGEFDKVAEGFLRRRVRRLCLLPEGVSPRHELEFWPLPRRPSLVVLDMPYCAADRQLVWKASGAVTWLLDEYGEQTHRSDVVVCAPWLSAGHEYRLRDEVQYLRGIEYMVVDPAFRHARHATQRQPGPARNVVVMLGLRITPATYGAVADGVSRIPGLVPTYLLHQDTDEEQLDALRPYMNDARVVLGTDCVADYMATADFAFMSAGHAKYEAACAGLPMALIAADEGQAAVAEAFALAGAADYLGMQRHVDAERIADYGRHVLFDGWYLQQMGQVGMDLVDGHGVDRLFEHLQEWLLQPGGDHVRSLLDEAAKSRH